MKNLRFCPECGHQALDWDGEKKWACRACKFVLFHNCAAAVAAVIRCGDEILFTKRNQEPAKGKLDLAGGFVDPHESAETACIRELQEELSVTLVPENLKIISTLPNVYHYQGIDYNTLDIFFEYRLEEKFTTQLELTEIDEVRWLSLNDVKLDEIAFDSQRIFLEDYLKNQ